MLVNLNDLLPEAEKSSGAIACVNVFGFEDALAVISAAEELDHPVIIATNKDMADMLGVECLAGMLLPLIERSSARICLHLDHCYDESIVYKAIHAGYSSVMFDGSQLPLEENIRRTRNVVDVAKALGVTVEGEIGSVPYDEGRDHIKAISTTPEEARAYAEESGIDALAISVGNIHRLTTPTSVIDYDLLEAVEELVTIPLVIHGTTGITESDIIKLKQKRVAKFNIGTSLRMVIGQTLRQKMAEQPEQFDRRHFMSQVFPLAQQEAVRLISLLK